jgi:CheY-like chemotaxis protein
MRNRPAITLIFSRADGKQEPVHLTDQTLADARAAAEYVLKSAGELYQKADVCVSGYIIETIQMIENEGLLTCSNNCEARASNPRMSLVKNPAKILVMEDNPADVHLLRMALDHHGEQYRLELLQDGEEALRFVHSQRTAPSAPEPCVIILDLHLPRHDGKAVLRAIKHEPSLCHVHVVALTSVPSPSDEREVRLLGVRLCKAKPMELDEWLALAAEILAICREPSAVTA